ncbi:hypothetical protein ACEPAI_4290 [Sanghuangporus weigelae]
MAGGQRARTGPIPDLEVILEFDGSVVSFFLVFLFIYQLCSMAHRRTPSTMYATVVVKEEKENPVLNASGVGVGISAILSAAATVLAPVVSRPSVYSYHFLILPVSARIIPLAHDLVTQALPLSAMRPSITLDRPGGSSTMSPSSSSSSSLSDDDYMSMTSLDLQTPLTPGTPSKFYPHPPRFPSYPAESSSRSALTKAHHSLRRFISRFLATLSPRIPDLPVKSPHLSPTSSSSYLASLPRRAHASVRRRATFLALLALIALCTWTLFTSSLGDTQSHARPYSRGVMRNWKDWRNQAQSREGDERARLLSSASFRAAAAAANSPATHTVSTESNSGLHVSSLELSPEDELAALTAFIAALPWNALPSHVDPSRPLDPTIILDFDPSHRRARDELVALRRETWQLNPVVLFGKSRHPPTREARAILEALSVDIKNGVMDVDMADRVDGDIVLGVLGRLLRSLESGSSASASSESSESIELPLLLIGGKPVRGSDVPKLVEGGELPRMLREAGVRMAVPGKKKKGGH